MITLLALSLLVILHELGHFVAARIFGVKVLEFGLGLPPKAMLLGKRGDTEYTLNYLPLGGFVRLYGEQGEMSKLDELNPISRRQALMFKPAWQRAIVLAAGAVMNLFIGVFLFAVIYTVTGVPKESGKQIIISQVVKDSPAFIAKLKVGDVVTKINDTEIVSADLFVQKVVENKGKAINLYVKDINQDGTTSDTSRVVTVIPRENPPVGQGALGVAVSDVPIVRYEKKPWYVAPFYGIVEGSKESYLWGREIAKGIVSLFSNLFVGKVPEGLSGPVGVVRAGNEAFTSGYLVYIRFIAIISINLGIFNLFPLPALDGGRLLFLVVEKIIGKKRVEKAEGIIHGVGFLLLIGVLVLVTWMDLRAK